MRKPRLPGVIALLFVALPLAAASPLEHQMHEVERIRGLTFLHDVKVVTVPRERLPEYLREQLSKSLPYSFDQYMLVLETLGFIEGHPANLQQRMIDLLDQQVLAFYDPQTHTYYALDKPPAGIPDSAKELPLDDAVAVHELTHALQDQRFGIAAKDARTRDDWDANMALHSVIEGEASLVMLAELVAPLGTKLDDIVSNDALMQGMSAATAMMRAADTTTPRYFIDSLAFPYVSGIRFVVNAYRRGGWAAVNRIYDDPPRSTREILHPDEYFEHHRTSNALAGAPALKPKGLLSVEHIGEWHWGFLLGADNAVGWRGDRVSIVQDPQNEPTVLVETRWDSPDRARKFGDAYLKFLDDHHIKPQLVVRGAEVNVAYGADNALIERFMAR